MCYFILLYHNLCTAANQALEIFCLPGEAERKAATAYNAHYEVQAFLLGYLHEFQSLA